MRHAKSLTSNGTGSFINKMLSTDQGEDRYKRKVINYLKDVSKVESLKTNSNKFGYPSSETKPRLFSQSFRTPKYEYPENVCSTTKNSNVVTLQIQNQEIQNTTKLWTPKNYYNSPFSNYSSKNNKKHVPIHLQTSEVKQNLSGKKLEINISIGQVTNLEFELPKSEEKPMRQRRPESVNSMQQTDELYGSFSTSRKKNMKFSLENHNETTLASSVKPLKSSCISARNSTLLKNTKEIAIKLVKITQEIKNLWKTIYSILKSNIIEFTELNQVPIIQQNISDKIFSEELFGFLYPENLPMLFYPSEIISKTQFENPDNFIDELLKIHMNLKDENFDYKMGIALSICYFKISKIKDSIEILQKILVRHKQNCYAYYNLSLILLTVSDYSQCEFTISNCLEIINENKTSQIFAFPDFMPFLYQILSICNFQLGKVSSASEAYLQYTKHANFQKIGNKFLLPSSQKDSENVIFVNVDQNKKFSLDSFKTGIQNEPEKQNLHSSENIEFSINPFKSARCKKSINSISHALIEAHTRKKSENTKNLYRPYTAKIKKCDKLPLELMSLVQSIQDAKKTSKTTSKSTKNIKKNLFRPLTAVPKKLEKTELNEDDVIDKVNNKSKPFTLPESIENRTAKERAKFFENYHKVNNYVTRVIDKFNNLKSNKIKWKQVREAALDPEGLSKLTNLIGSVFFIKKC